MAEADPEIVTEALSKAYDELCSTVLGQKRRLGELLENLDPLKVMLRAVCYSRSLSHLRSSDLNDAEERDPFDELFYNNANLIPEYLQSCLLCIAANDDGSSEGDTASARLEEMLSGAEAIIEQLSQGMLARFSHMHVTGKEAGLSEDILRYQIEAKGYQSLRGKRYQVVNEDFLSLLLCRQDDLIRLVYGIGCTEVVEGFVALMRSLTSGWVEAMQSLQTQLEVYRERGDAGFDAVAKDEVANIAESVFGCRLYDVSAVTHWPEELIDDLSLPAASVSDSEAFEALDPLGIMPISKKPFIRIADKSYCFCAANFLDNFYRSFYQAIRGRYVLSGMGSGNEFVALWKERQALASEAGAAELIRKLLPNSYVCINGFHPAEGTNWSKHNCRESDLVVLYGDALLAIEVKAGAFCPTDPADDPEGHIGSFRALLEKASHQAESTVEYVHRCCGETCRFYDENGQVKFEFSPTSVRTVYKICVTVDDFNEFASKADKLGFIEMGSDVIALSFDDLLVYSRYFDNPLIFLHYLAQRRSAASMPALYMNDELDHLGMYIANNCYVKTIERQAEECGLDFRNDSKARIMGFYGSREPIDRWFEEMCVGKDSPKPVQESPEVLNRIIGMLDNPELGYWRRAVASTLLNCGSENREAISKGINLRLRCAAPPNLQLGLPAPDSADVPLSIFVDRDESPNDDEICRRKCLAVLIRDEVPLVVRLDIRASEGKVTSLGIIEYKAVDLSEEDRRSTMGFVESLGETRKSWIKNRLGRKIGRNERCPCGSGKKYKRCCWR